jgi:hypothetical protein
VADLDLLVGFGLEPARLVEIANLAYLDAPEPSGNP